MSPGRPLPDLCLIAVFQMMPPNDQLKASLMSPRCARLMRAANRSVKTLLITDKDFTKNPDIFKDIKNQINSYSLASKPSMQQLMDAGETFPDYLMPIAHLSKWNCLQLDRYSKLDTASTEQIANAFSAVTDLKLIGFLCDSIVSNEMMVSLLKFPTLKCQLTNLMVKGVHQMNNYQTHRLILAINGLTALQQLTINMYDYHHNAPDLTILAQLKVVVFDSNYLNPFLNWLERHAADNAHLQVHLFNCVGNDLFSLIEPLRSRIVRYEKALDCNYFQVPLLCSQFSSLTSVFICNVKSRPVGPLFTALSQLQQLIHLRFGVIFGRDNEEAAALPPRPLAKLNSLQALDLVLAITSHSQIEWLNLPWTMPYLKTIYIEQFFCARCDVWFDCQEYYPPLSSPEALECYRASLFHLHSRVPLTQFILQMGEERTSVEKLLLQSE